MASIKPGTIQKGLKTKLKWMTRRNSGKDLGSIIAELNPVLRGFINYFRVANCTRVMKQLMGWLRRRLRCVQVKQWKTPSRLHRRLKQLGLRRSSRSGCKVGAMRAVRWQATLCPIAGCMTNWG